MAYSLTRSLSLFLGTGLMLGTLAACGTAVDTHKLENEAHYWQRANTTSAIHTRGPKAQQMLNRDIAQCVVEVRELDRLGALRHALPNDTHHDPSSPQGHLDSHDTPERDGYLRSEHFPFVDFETCMIYKGWERIQNVPYDIADESKDVYIQTVLDEKYQTKYGDDGQRKPDMTSNETDFND